MRIRYLPIGDTAMTFFYLDTQDHAHYHDGVHFFPTALICPSKKRLEVGVIEHRA